MQSEASEIVRSVVERLARRRQQLRLSKRQVALAAGIDPKTVGLIERGERSPTLHTLILISVALHEDLARVLSKSQKREI